MRLGLSGYDKGRIGRRFGRKRPLAIMSSDCSATVTEPECDCVVAGDRMLRPCLLHAVAPKLLRYEILPPGAVEFACPPHAAWAELRKTQYGTWISRLEATYGCVELAPWLFG